MATFPWITGLATATPVASFTETHFARVVARWSLKTVSRTPENTLPFAVALAAAALPLIDLCRARTWALIFTITLVVTATGVAVLAFLQNYTQATGVYWSEIEKMPANFCGTFFHHTAAGAYFNTAWPLAAGLSVAAWSVTRTPLSTSVAVVTSAATLLLFAAHGSHISRFPQVAALLVAPFLWLGLKIRVRGKRALVLGATGIAALLLILTMSGRLGDITARWRYFFTHFSTSAFVEPTISPPESAWPALIRDDLFIPFTSHYGWLGDRGEGWHTALRAIADRPLTGHGPANWMGAASQHSDDPFVRTFFQFLQFTHQDLLQCAVEWGVPATLGWWGFLVGAVVAVVRTRGWRSPLHRSLAVAAACALAAVLLQAQLDFPLEMPAVALNVIVLAALAWSGRVSPASSVHPRIASIA
ncbi:O-antigen ligase family protein [Oleiharenicola lentus]|uniref:O-antigen ligase family protein n=1 Tax=Oleiharenicola lentus TaxID=2508720 RepID=UPI003F67E54B